MFVFGIFLAREIPSFNCLVFSSFGWLSLYERGLLSVGLSILVFGYVSSI